MQALKSTRAKRAAAALLLAAMLWPLAAMAAKSGGDGDDRFSTVTRGVLRDADTGLQWTANDSRFSVTWNDAKEYCTGLQIAGGGWRLPSVVELQQIYDPSFEGVVCSSSGSKCHVSSLFHLTSYWFWSSTKSGSGGAWLVNLGNGNRTSDDVSHSDSARALCVRRS